MVRVIYVYVDTIFGLYVFCFVCLFACLFFNCLVQCYSTIVLTSAGLSALSMP